VEGGKGTWSPDLPLKKTANPKHPSSAGRVSEVTSASRPLRRVRWFRYQTDRILRGSSRYSRLCEVPKECPDLADQWRAAAPMKVSNDLEFCCAVHDPLMSDIVAKVPNARRNFSAVKKPTDARRSLLPSITFTEIAQRVYLQR